MLYDPATMEAIRKSIDDAYMHARMFEPCMKVAQSLVIYPHPHKHEVAMINYFWDTYLQQEGMRDEYKQKMRYIRAYINKPFEHCYHKNAESVLRTGA